MKTYLLSHQALESWLVKLNGQSVLSSQARSRFQRVRLRSCLRYPEPVALSQGGQKPRKLVLRGAALEAGEDSHPIQAALEARPF